MSKGPTECIHTVIVAVGSNIERHHNLPKAVHLMCGHPDLVVRRVSSIYESSAVGGDYPVFSNAAVSLETHLDALRLRAVLRGIEAIMGRVRSEDKFAPRPIDLDIALFDRCIVDLSGTRVPDPDILRYAHVAVPMAEIEPGRIHPQTGRTLAEIARDIDQSGLQKIGRLERK